jgi:hypothetical protein
LIAWRWCSFATKYWLLEACRPVRQIIAVICSLRLSVAFHQPVDFSWFELSVIVRKTVAHVTIVARSPSMSRCEAQVRVTFSTNRFYKKYHFSLLCNTAGLQKWSSALHSPLSNFDNENRHKSSTCIAS